LDFASATTAIAETSLTVPKPEAHASSESESSSGSDSSDSEEDDDSDSSDTSDTDSEAERENTQQKGAEVKEQSVTQGEGQPNGTSSVSSLSVAVEKVADGVGDESHQDVAPSSPTLETKEVAIQNISAWAELGGDSPQGHEKEASKSADKTWSTFQNRKILEHQRELERHEKEERLRREREQKEEEKRRAEEQKRKEQEARDAPRLKEAQEAELVAQRERERLRLAAKLERERETQNINMTEQSILMADFEHQTGVTTPSILPMFQYKDDKEDDFDQMEEGELV